MSKRKQCKFTDGSEQCRTGARTLGYCAMHYQQFRLSGPDSMTLYPKLRRGVGRNAKGFSVASNGYRRIRVANGQEPVRWVLEHRYVMEAILGRPLESTEHVHHKDGNRLNNDPSNLELWISRRQPTGVRLSDALIEARELLQKYEGVDL